MRTVTRAIGKAANASQVTARRHGSSLRHAATTPIRARGTVDQITVGWRMKLTLSCDHRIVDGHVGAAFAYDVIGILEDPERLSEYV